MTRAIISVHVGGAGSRLGKELIDLYSEEQALETAGIVSSVNSNLSTSTSLFFDATSSTCNYFEAREGMRAIHGQSVSSSIRNTMERCDSIAGFVVTRSLGGGYGSGGGSGIISQLRDICPSSVLVEQCIFPSASYSVSPLETYNAVFALSDMSSRNSACDLCILMDNEAAIAYASNTSIEPDQIQGANSLYCSALSDITAPLRFGNSNGSSVVLNSTLEELVTNLVPTPDHRFGLLSTNRENVSCGIGSRVLPTSEGMVRSLFNRTSYLCDIPAQSNTGVYLAASVYVRQMTNAGSQNCDPSSLALFTKRGAASLKQFDIVRGQMQQHFVKWIPQSFKLGIIETRMPHKSESLTEGVRCTMVANNSLAGHLISRELCQFTKMRLRRNHYWHLIQHGAELDDFDRASESLSVMIDMYRKEEADSQQQVIPSPQRLSNRRTRRATVNESALRQQSRHVI